MALRALSIAATGGRALMSKIDTIANNLSNVNTAGFKRTRTNFADLFYRDHAVKRASAVRMRQRLEHFKQAVGRVRLDAIDQYRIEQYLTRRTKEVAAPTVNTDPPRSNAEIGSPRISTIAESLWASPIPTRAR